MSIEVDWSKYPLVNDQELPKAWLSFEAYRGLAANTIEAYGRALIGWRAPNAPFTGPKQP